MGINIDLNLENWSFQTFFTIAQCFASHPQIEEQKICKEKFIATLDNISWLAYYVVTILKMKYNIIQ